MKELFSTGWKALVFHPFLNLLLILYSLFGNNLGWAVIVLAILSRLLLIPSTRKQMGMTKIMSDLKPQLEKLQKKYKNNQEELAKEQMKLYKKVGYNPLGCFGSFMPQLIILAAIIGVIRTITEGTFEGVYPYVRDWLFDGSMDITLNTRFLFW